MSEKKVILVVDDDPDFLFQEKAYLEKAGYEVQTAESQVEAERILNTQKLDAAVFDLMMEFADSGFTLCYQAKKIDPEMPVVMITSANSGVGFSFDLDTPSNRSWIRADAFLQKPIRFEQLVSELERLVK